MGGGTPEKLLVTASGCAGKTTFSKKKNFCGYTLSDSLIKQYDRKESFEDFQLSFWKNQADKICVCDTLFKFRFIDGVHTVVVMPPKRIHLKNYKVRRKITGTFSMKWILIWRKEILRFAGEHNLEIFPDFETALTLISRNKKNSI